MKWQDELATGPNIIKERLDKMDESKQLAQMNRERVQRHRDNKRKTLVKVEVWIKPAYKQQLLDYIKELNA